MNTGSNYLISSKAEFHRYKLLGEKAIAQLEPEQLFITSNDDSNSIVTIIKHLHGNMLSRWTDFLTTDGEKPWRARDNEFENTLENKQTVLQLWENGWQCLFDALEPLREEQLLDIITIREEAHTVIQAINRQLTHYAYHVGQIVFIAKQLKSTEWNSLSIPKKK